MISKKEYKKAKKIIKAYKKQLIIPVVVGMLCEHNWHHLDNHSDRMMCVKCDKQIQRHNYLQHKDKKRFNAFYQLL